MGTNKKQANKLLLSFLAMLMPLISSAYDFEVDGIFYKITSTIDLTAEVTFGETKYSGNIIIPSTTDFRGKQLYVTKIGSEAFKGCRDLISVSIAEGITSIASEAFSGCSNLEKISLPTSVKRIEDWYAFYNCKKITELPLKEGIEFIGGYAFYGCDGLTNVSIPRSVTNTGYSIFGKCQNLKSIFIPKNITELNDMFSDCMNIETIKIEGAFPPYVESSYYFFNKEITLNANLYVSKNAANYYTSTEYWKDFFVIEEDETLGICNYLCVNSVKNGKIQIQGKEISNNKSPITLGAFNGDTIIIKFIPNDKYRVKSFRINGIEKVDEIINKEYSFILTNNDTIDVEFVRYYDLIISSEGYYGTVYVNSVAIQNDIDTLKIDAGVPVEMHLKLTEGYCATAKTSSYYTAFKQINDTTYVLEKPIDFKVSFSYSKILIQLYSTCKGNGVFYTNNTLITNEHAWTNTGCYYNDIISLTFTPDKGHHLASLFINDIEVIEEVVNNEYDFIAKANKEIRIVGSFEVSSYLLVYTVDGEIVKSDSVAYGTTITLPEEPIKEGYTFSGWSETYRTMPDNDVIISGTFIPNKYLVTFKIDDEVISADSLEYGTVIVAPGAPDKEGHTFNGWDEVLETVPANDVTIEGSYSVNSYLLTYVVDGEIVKADSIAYGTVITLLDEPTKEGYTFSGWSETYRTMPDNDVIISGTFIPNKYLVTFKIDDEVISADSLEYGTVIVAPGAPDKEGHTFNGWDEVLETVPANDVTIEGSYSVNSYLLTYVVDGEIVKADSIAYGTVITLLDEPTKEGYTFSGWSEAPETMPASDVTVSGIFTINQYTITYIIDGEVFATDTINYGEAITVPEVPVKENYDFAWIDEIPETMPAEDIVINGSYTSTDIVNIEYNEEVLYIYTTDGRRVNGLQKGINIVLLKDGSIRKVFQK